MKRDCRYLLLSIGHSEIRSIFYDENYPVDFNLEQFPNLELVEIGKYKKVVDGDDSFTLYKIIKRIDFIAICNTG